MRRNQRRYIGTDKLEKAMSVLLALIVVGIVIALLLATGGAAADEPNVGRADEERDDAGIVPYSGGVDYGISDALRELIEVNKERYAIEATGDKILRCAQNDSNEEQATTEESAIVTEEDSAETLKYLGNLKVVGYNPFDPKQVGKKVADAITASGELAIPGETCAMSKDIPFGTVIEIVGLGRFTVNDRGVGSGIVDVACATDEDCYAITGRYDVYIVEGSE